MGQEVEAGRNFVEQTYNPSSTQDTAMLVKLFTRELKCCGRI